MCILRSPDLHRLSYAKTLNFVDNQFEKAKIDPHDQVISMLHSTKESQLIHESSQDEIEQEEGEEEGAELE